MVPYCCSNDKRCCSGKCCEKEEYCCSQHSPDPSSSPVCCPSSTHCCHNSRGEVVCCPELVKQIWILIGLILLVYTASKFSRAFRAYCNIVPFEDENTNLLEERDVQKMKYCFFGFDTAALRRGQLRQVLSLWWNWDWEIFHYGMSMACPHFKYDSCFSSKLKFNFKFKFPWQKLSLGISLSLIGLIKVKLSVIFSKVIKIKNTLFITLYKICYQNIWIFLLMHYIKLSTIIFEKLHSHLS